MLPARLRPLAPIVCAILALPAGATPSRSSASAMTMNSM